MNPLPVLQPTRRRQRKPASNQLAALIKPKKAYFMPRRGSAQVTSSQVTWNLSPMPFSVSKTRNAPNPNPCAPDLT